MDLVGLVVAQDVATAGCGALNGAYFGEYWSRSELSRGRRIGGAALATLSAATVFEALFSEAVLWSARGALAFSADPSGLWALSRLPLLLATLFISALIMRRMRS